MELFGQKLESPLLVAPVGVQTIFHLDKETGVAEIANEIGVPYVLSTASSSSIEDVAKANGDGTRWYQLYWPQDNNITISVPLPSSTEFACLGPALTMMSCHSSLDALDPMATKSSS